MELSINLNQWTTPTAFAEKNGVSPQVVNNWAQRNKIQRIYIAELNITLVAELGAPVPHGTKAEK